MSNTWCTHLFLLVLEREFESVERQLVRVHLDLGVAVRVVVQVRVGLRLLVQHRDHLQERYTVSPT